MPIAMAADLVTFGRNLTNDAWMTLGDFPEHAKGAGRAVFREPQHPYTWGLLDSIPRVGLTRGRRLTVIPGQPPSLLAPPPGCRFAPRCIYRFPKCDERPALVAKVEADHADACHLEPSARRGLRDERRTA
jgi:oligopeptide/dipeptide ABC transporter ATP-binding protein